MTYHYLWWLTILWVITRLYFTLGGTVASTKNPRGKLQNTKVQTVNLKIKTKFSTFKVQKFKLETVGRIYTLFKDGCFVLLAWVERKR